MDTKILVKRAKKGDKEALVKLIMESKDEYYKLAYVYMKNKEDSLDALEDMIVILYEKIYELRKEEYFYSWSKTILVNCCKKILRQKNKVLPLDTIEEGLDDDKIIKKDNEIVLKIHLDKLSSSHQEVLKLRYFLDLDYKTISEILKIPLGTVKSRISIGLNKLKDSLGGEDYEGI